MYTTPEAHICVKRNRVKVYSDKIYLQDKQEFEFELFNPTTKTQLAQISLNGKQISTSGIVIKPGQRIYLDRFLDTPDKFRFDTYLVEDSKEVAKAIQDNGKVSISFRAEKETPVFTPIVLNSPTYEPYKHPFSYTSTKCSYMSNSTSKGIGGQSINSLRSMKSAPTLDQMDFMSEVASLKETGKVEKGSKSDQTFYNYNGDFEFWVNKTITYQMMPASARPVETADIANYCTECGAKNKGSKYKFCPSCGHKF